MDHKMMGPTGEGLRAGRAGGSGPESPLGSAVAGAGLSARVPLR